MSVAPVVIRSLGVVDVSCLDVMGDQMKLKDKVALVTGTSPNIGGGLAEALAAEGAAVVSVDASAANANDCAAYIKSIGGSALGITCDVTDEAQVTATVQKACETFGRIDVLVNNAVFFNKKGVLTMPLAEWRKRAEQHRLLDGQGRDAELHPLRGDGAGEARHPGQQPHPHRDRSVGIVGAGAALGPRGDRPLGVQADLRDVSQPHPDAEAPQPQRLRPGRRLHPMMTGTDLRIDAGAVARYWPWDPAPK
jgi:hypothetical protein